MMKSVPIRIEVHDRVKKWIESFNPADVLLDSSGEISSDRSSLSRSTAGKRGDGRSPSAAGAL